MVDVSISALARYLKLHLTDDAPEKLHLTIEAQLRRSGKIVRLVEPSGKPVGNGEPQPHIVRLVQLAQRWWREM